MKARVPRDKDDLLINKNDRVLEIGSGHNPHPRSNVIVEKYIDSNYHRSGSVKIFPYQEFINGDGGNLPFRDKEFDYVICSQVLEHVDDPAAFIKEQCRVANRGYMETPSLIGEWLFPKTSHKWVILQIDNKLVLFDKSKMPGNYGNNYGELFLNYLPFQSLTFKLLWFTERNLFINRYEWNDEIDFIVNPDDSYYSSFFTQKWTREMVEKIFPPRSFIDELKRLFYSLFHIIRAKIRSTLFNSTPQSLDDYLNAKKNKEQKDVSIR